MAATAKVEGTVLTAASLTIAEWSDLQRRVRADLATVTMPYCHCRGHLSVSRLQTQYFKHYANDSECEYATAGESEEHLFAKHQIAAGVRDAGWTAKVEASSRKKQSQRWRADVLAILGNKQTAFEVQRSHQAVDEYLFRTQRYRSSGVDALWFIYSDPIGHARLRELEVSVFQIEVGFDLAKVTGLGEDEALSMPLQEFVTGWLGGKRPKLKPKPKAPATHRAEPLSGSRLAALRRPVGPVGKVLPQKPCPNGCNPGMSLSFILGCWVCMSCRRTMGPSQEEVWIYRV